jgi:hypothetical protein
LDLSTLVEIFHEKKLVRVLSFILYQGTALVGL